jgi:hypothetical protein
MASPPNARLRASLLLAACCLGPPVTAQQRDEPGGEQRALRRATDDALIACREVLLHPMAFTGSCTFSAGRAGFADDVEPIPFRGAWHEGLLLFHLRQHTVLSHGERQLVRVGDAGWTPPQGDAPDLPFSPRTLAQQVAAACIDTAEPVFLDGRPALRVHAVWTGSAATALLRDSYHPQAQVQQILERMPTILERQPAERVCVDAAICYDPATRTLRSFVVRAALLDGNAPRADDAPPPAPAGLPPLPRAPLLAYTFTGTLVPLTDVPMPELDAAMRERLAWPPAAQPAAAAPGTIR